MSSGINDANPEQGNATTASVRANFAAAKKEINDLQKMSTMFSRTAGSGSAYTASFTDQFETDALVDGARVTVEIHTISTSTTPTLTVTAGGTGTGTKTIVKAGSTGGSALVAGDLKEDALIELMYVASGGDGITDKWVWLNCVSDSANLLSPALSGTPTAPTAAEDTNTTQIATTAFVQTATPDASDSVKGIAELATAAEVKAGTDATRILTPANLLREAVVNSVTGSNISADGDQGSIEIAGVIIKFGRCTVPKTGTTPQGSVAITFSNAFDNHIFSAYVSNALEEYGNFNDALNGLVSVKNLSTTGLTVQQRYNLKDVPAYWLAIGG